MDNTLKKYDSMKVIELKKICKQECIKISKLKKKDIIKKVKSHVLRERIEDGVKQLEQL
jgi:hypothetical protein